MKLNQFLFLALTSTFVLSGCGSTEPATTEIPPTPTSLVIYGDVTADHPQLISLDFPAKVTSVHVKNGDSVQKGDVLFTIDYSDYLLALSSKEKELEMAEIELKHLEQSLNPLLSEYDATSKQLALKKKYQAKDSNPDLMILKGELEVLEEQLTTAKNLYATNEELFANHFLSQNDLEASKQAYQKLLQQKESLISQINKLEDALNLAVNTLSDTLKSLKSQISNTDQEKATKLEKLRVQISGLEEALTNMKNKLNKSYLKDNTIIAPDSNLVVYDIPVMNGTDLTSTEGVLGKFLSKDSLYILADIPEDSLGVIEEGQTVSITLAGDTDSSPKLTGTISQIADCAIIKAGDTVIEARIDVEDTKFLKAGLSADITISY